VYGDGGHTFDRAVAILREEGPIESVRGKRLFVKER